MAMMIWYDRMIWYDMIWYDTMLTMMPAVVTIMLLLMMMMMMIIIFYQYSDNYRFSPQQTSGPGCEVACVKSVPIRISSMRTFESDTLKSLEWKLKKWLILKRNLTYSMDLQALALVPAQLSPMYIHTEFLYISESKHHLYISTLQWWKGLPFLSFPLRHRAGGWRSSLWSNAGGHRKWLPVQLLQHSASWIQDGDR